jgi:Holliday junction resolvasome RuvABC endonuclease subunit
MGAHVTGVDPSLTAAAVAHSEGLNPLLLCGRKGLTVATNSLPWRALQLDAHADDVVQRIIGGGMPALVVIELLPRAGTRFDPERGYLWWAIVRDLVGKGVPVLEVSVATIKKYATGKGNASKQAMIEATVRRLPQYETGGDDNLCDALWAMAIGKEMIGEPVVDMPKVNREALAKLVLPAGLW